MMVRHVEVSECPADHQCMTESRAEDVVRAALALMGNLSSRGTPA